MKKIIIIASILAITIGYNVWLDSGCEVSGVMAWQGKTCFENL